MESPAFNNHRFHIFLFLTVRYKQNNAMNDFLVCLLTRAACSLDDVGL